MKAGTNGSAYVPFLGAHIIVITVKILGLGSPERYAVRRLVVAAQQELLSQRPDLELKISEVNAADEIGRYASVLVLPTLLINERVVCTGRFPTKEQLIAWLREA